MIKIFEMFRNSNTISDIIKLMSELENEYNVSWRPVGGINNNLAIINMGSDPAAGVAERLTNGIDAVLERKWEENNRPTYISSPRHACEEWFGIKEGRLVNVENVRQKDNPISKISDNLHLSIYDSDVSNKPTLEFRDRGIGVTVDRFHDTVLSLNQNNKLGKRFLMGAFGQGGSTTLAYSEYTIIMSKSMHDKNKIGCTIVKFDQGNIYTDKHGKYVYAINKNTGHPFSFEVSEKDFECGTLIKHIAMDLGNFQNQFNTQINSLFFLTNHYLFDTILPFKIIEKRESQVAKTKKNKHPIKIGDNRTVTGNYRLLCHRICSIGERETSIYQRDAVKKINEGKIKIKWWVLPDDKNDNNQRNNKVIQYVNPSKPIIVTYNGQKQGEITKSILKKDLNIPYLADYIVVHVDCDDIDMLTKRDLFSTTRESMKLSNSTKYIKQIIKETLMEDDELHRLNLEYKKNCISNSNVSNNDEIKNNLIKKLNKHNKYNNKVSITSNNNLIKQKTTLPSIPTLNPPNLLEVCSHKSKNVYAGQKCNIKFKTNADSSCVNDESFNVFPEPIGCAQYVGYITVKDGYGSACIDISEDVNIGDTICVNLELRPKNSKSLSASINLNVIEKPKKETTINGNNKIELGTLEYIDSNDDLWYKYDWDENSVASIVVGDNIDIYVSKENINLNPLILKAGKDNKSIQTLIENKYLERIAHFALLLHLKDKEDLSKNNNEENEDVDIQFEKYSEKALQTASETICEIISSEYDILLKEAKDE